MIKCLAYYGYYKFYFNNYIEFKELKSKWNISDYIIRRYDYYTFSTLAKLQNHYLKGEKILSQYESTKNIIVPKGSEEQIFSELNICFDPYTMLLDKTKNSYSNVRKENYGISNQLPICGANEPIISFIFENGRLKF